MGNTILTIRLCVWAIAVVACVILVPHSANGQIYHSYGYDSHVRLQQYMQSTPGPTNASGSPYGNPILTFEDWSYDNAGNRQGQLLTVNSTGNPVQPPTCSNASVSVTRGQTITLNGISTCNDPQGYPISVSGITPTITAMSSLGKTVTLLNNSTSANGTITISATSNSPISPNYDPNYTPGNTYGINYTVQDTYGGAVNVGIQVQIN